MRSTCSCIGIIEFVIGSVIPYGSVIAYGQSLHKRFGLEELQSVPAGKSSNSFTHFLAKPRTSFRLRLALARGVSGSAGLPGCPAAE